MTVMKVYALIYWVLWGGGFVKMTEENKFPPPIRD